MILLVIDSLCYTPALVTDNHIIQLFLVTSLKPNMNTLVCPGHRWLCNCSESERFTRVLLSQSLTPELSRAVVTISSVAVTNQSNKVQSTHVSEHHWLVSAPELGVCQLWQWVLWPLASAPPAHIALVWTRESWATSHHTSALCNGKYTTNLFCVHSL